MGQASPKPIVITASAARTASSVSGFGNSFLMSIPTSAIVSSKPAAIWLRPALWRQTNRTSGTRSLVVSHLPSMPTSIALTIDTYIDIYRYMVPIDLELAPKRKRPAGEPCCDPLVYPDIERAQAERMAAVAKALGDPIRMQLVDVLRKHAGKV